LNNLNDILQTIGNGLAGDETLIDWCETNMGDAPAVHLGIDPDHPPKGGGPIIEIATGSRSRNLNTSSIEHQLMVGCMYRDRDLTETDTLTVNNAMTLTNDMAELVELAVVGILDDNHILWQPDKADLPDALGLGAARAIWCFRVSVRSVI
jgi:poly(3-hydroxybutyrate) depolymerase